MTVRELIAELQEYDPDMSVCFTKFKSFCEGPFIQEVEQDLFIEDIGTDEGQVKILFGRD